MNLFICYVCRRLARLGSYRMVRGVETLVCRECAKKYPRPKRGKPRSGGPASLET